ncbi:MAG: calcium-binding protein [Moorea sp. SIOASIH]|uniref:calcium-binding protein n=1 Tax=Moorena sp. SIOASIH TaxID=2607817 RepID=UPI0013BE0426|nr:calcium-binding protein [Moorena sp. SIOASIH]NEO37349.1 calcium-binding protein [Moorena sp. SIOASIH]
MEYLEDISVTELEELKEVSPSLLIPEGESSKTPTTTTQIISEDILTVVPQSDSDELSKRFLPFPRPFNVILGTPGADVLPGTNYSDIILGRGGNDIILGLGGNDFLFGEDGNDVVVGGSGNDFLSGGNGQDFLFGSSGQDTLDGGNGDDFLSGGTGYNLFIGSTGNDTLNGEDGRDTVDYTGLGRAITLLPTGIVNKNGLGKDELIRVETIIGDRNQANTIDASSAGTGASINVDLQQEKLQVNVVGGPFLNRTVRNFINVKGTGLSDTIAGNKLSNKLSGGGGNDIISGSAGNDVIDGGSGKDTVDYTGLGRAITVLPTGIVDKGGLGKDQLIAVEKVIGDAGQVNTIDASSAGTTASVNVDLQKESLQVNIVGDGTLNFGVENFVNVKGTGRNDTIVGDNQNNQLTGGAGSDKILGGGGKDTIVGVDPNSLSPGVNEIDILTGGAGADKFVLGDSKNTYYEGRGFLGLNDYALITDFQSGTDKIQLKKDNYLFGRNFIAVRKGFYYNDLSSVASAETVVNNLSEGVINDSGSSLGAHTTGDSLESGRIVSNLDIIAIVSDGYSQSDIEFV